MITTVATTTLTPAVSHVHFTTRRTTALGIQYTTTDNRIVTVNGTSSSCSCGMENSSIVCVHGLAALAQERAYTEEAQKRSAYCIEFAIY